MNCRHPRTLLLAAGWLIAAATGAGAATGPWQENPQSKVRLISPYAVAPAAGGLRLGLELTVIPGWHVYWKNSGDAGFPPAIDFSPTAEVARAELLWPAPSRYELAGGLVAYGYEEHVVYPVRMRLATGERDAVTLAADLDYLVCEVDCVPYSYRLTLDQPLAAVPAAAVPDPETAALVDAWWDRLPVPAERAAAVATWAGLDLDDPGSPALVVEVDGPGAAAANRPEVFLAAHDLFTTGAPRLERLAYGVRFRVPLAFNDARRPPPRSTEIDWTITGLDPAAGPAAVEARRTVGAFPGGIAPGARGRVVRASPPPPLARLTWLAWLALAGGLLAALTPAALPLLAGEALDVARRAGGGPGSPRRAALATAAGIGAGWVGLAALAPALRARGFEPSWGAAAASPVVLALLALLALLAALRLWGLLGRWPPWVAGLAAAPLALAWPLTPLARAVEGAAQTGGPAGSALALVAVAGLAALPAALGFLLFARRSPALGAPEAAGAIALPGRPARPREALGFVAAGSVVWILYLLAGRLDPARLAFVELALLAVGLAAWLRGRPRARPARRAAMSLTLVLLAALVVWLAGDAGAAPGSAASAAGAAPPTDLQP